MSTLHNSMDFKKEKSELKNRAKTIINQARHSVLNGDYGAALSLYEEAQEIASKTNEDKLLSDSILGIGVVNSYHGEVQAAYEYYHKSLIIKQRLDDKRGIAYVLNNIAKLLSQQGEIEKSLKYYLDSLAIKEEISDELTIGSTLNNIANLFLKLENPAQALAYFQQSLRLKQKLRDENGVAVTLHNIGRVYRKQKNFKEALSYFERSLNLKKQAQSKQHLATIINSIGLVNKALQKNDEAILYFKEALQLGYEVNQTEEIAQALMNIGGIYVEEHDFDEALIYLTEALAIAEESNYLPIKREILEGLVKCHEGKDGILQAFKFQKMLLELERELFKIKRTEELAKLQVQFELLQKEKEIELQRTLLGEKEAVNKKLEEITEQLGAKNEELKRFVSVASHDLKEPLRMIRSFGQLLKRTYDGSERGKEYITYIVESSQRMTRLLEDLLVYAKMGVTNKAPDAIDLNEIVMMIKHNLRLQLEEKRGRILSGKLPVIHGHFTKIVQLFQNLVSNSIKYHRLSVPPIIQIEFEESENSDFYRIIIRDNGIGIEERFLERIFKPFIRLHTRRQYEGSGVGLATCTKIVELYGGNIWATSIVGQGSIFYFELRKWKEE